MTIKDFFNKWNGKGIDFDGYYGYQCVDLYRQYCQEVLGIPQSPKVTGASNIWESYLKEHFIEIKNTPDAIPQFGDIIIWNKYAGGGYGHVAIFDSGDVDSFTSFDQNWPVGSLCHFQPHNYTNVIGWLRPKSIQQLPQFNFTDQTIIPLGEPYGNMELQAVRSILKAKDQAISNLGSSVMLLELKLKTCEEKPPVEIEKEVIKEVFVKPDFKKQVSKVLYEIAIAIEGK